VVVWSLRVAPVMIAPGGTETSKRRKLRTTGVLSTCRVVAVPKFLERSFFEPSTEASATGAKVAVRG